MVLLITFEKILREHRDSKGKTQGILADTASLNRSFLSELETGKSQPTITTLFKIAEVLEIKPHLLIKELEELIKQGSEK